MGVEFVSTILIGSLTSFLFFARRAGGGVSSMVISLIRYQEMQNCANLFRCSHRFSAGYSVQVAVVFLCHSFGLFIHFFL